MENETDFNLLRKWWFWAILLVLLIGLVVWLFGGWRNPDEDPAVGPSPTPAVTPGAQQTPETTPQAQPGANEVDDEAYGYQSGTYKVGTDIPEGEYKLIATNENPLYAMAYFEIARDSSNTVESIIANDNFSTFSYVQIVDEQYFKIINAIAIPVDLVAAYTPVEGRYTEGMYKVGFDIAQGEYRIMEEEDNPMGVGYFEITNDALHLLDSIESNNLFNGSVYITVNEGQYLKLVNAYIEE